MKRSIYAGAVGYFSQDNQADFAIAIRTMVVKGKKRTCKQVRGLFMILIRQASILKHYKSERAVGGKENDFISR